MSSRTPGGTRTPGWIPLVYVTVRHWTHYLSKSHVFLFYRSSWGGLTWVLVDITVRTKRGWFCWLHCCSYWVLLFHVCWRWIVEHLLVCVSVKWHAGAILWASFLHTYRVVQNKGTQLNSTFVCNVNITDIVFIGIVLVCCLSLDMPLCVQCAQVRNLRSPSPCS
jgi:hypothetical protein